MDKKEFIEYLNEILKPNGFKKRGNTWTLKGDELMRVVQLQKSKFGNCYYLNYGFIINSLDNQKLEMHVFNRLGSIDDSENKRIMKLLDFDNDLSDSERKQELLPFIKQSILCELKSITKENQLLSNLKNRHHLNDIPLIVKDHFHL